MKKIITLLLTLLMICGCSQKSATELDITSASKALDNQLSEMTELKNDELTMIYNLDTSLLEEYIIKFNTHNTGEFYGLIKVKDGNKDTVKEAMTNLFERLEAQSNLYSPDAVKLLQNRLETSVGNYLIYLVGHDNNALYDIVKQHIN